ncbi:MAG: cation transporter [Cytophagaceae bacterium]
MKTLKFKTNINCGGCVAKATPVLNQISGITKWEVDTTNKDKILTTEIEDKVSSNDIESKLKDIGFNAVPLE